MHGRSSVLGVAVEASGLISQVLAPKIKIRMIPPPGEEDGPGAAAAGPESAAARGRGRPGVHDQEELTPDLVQFLLTHAELKAVAKVAKVTFEIDLCQKSLPNPNLLQQNGRRHSDKR